MDASSLPAGDLTVVALEEHRRDHPLAAQQKSMQLPLVHPLAFALHYALEERYHGHRPEVEQMDLRLQALSPSGFALDGLHLAHLLKAKQGGLRLHLHALLGLYSVHLGRGHPCLTSQ